MRTHVACLAFALAVCLVQPGQSQEENGRIIGRVVTAGGIPAAGVRIAVESSKGTVVAELAAVAE